MGDLGSRVQRLLLAATAITLMTLVRPIYDYFNKNNEKISQSIQRAEKLELRTLSLGLALESVDYRGNPVDTISDEALRSSLDYANYTLMTYGIQLEIDEIIEIDMPSIEDTKYLSSSIIRSFESPHDYYFVLTPTGYATRDAPSSETKMNLSSLPESSYAVNSMVEDRVSIMASGLPEEEIGDAMVMEILRLFLGEENSIYTEHDLYRTDDFDISSITDNRFMELMDEPYNIELDGEIRRLTANVALDNVTEDYAASLLGEVSREYTETFGIEIAVNGFYTNLLSANLTEEGIDYEFEEFKSSVEEPSDIYIIFTDKYITGFFGSKALGQATIDDGYMWISTNEMYVDNATIIIGHELAHLFGVDHVYRLGAVMHNSATEWNWANSTIDIILENKYMTWGESSDQ